MKSLLFVLILLATLALFGACSKSDSAETDKSTGQTASKASPTPPLTGFEKDLQYVKNGQYSYIYVFSRKDGKPLDKEDGAFLRTNAPQVVDWITTDEGRKVIAGTNFNLEEGNMAALRKRFVAEDFTGK